MVYRIDFKVTAMGVGLVLIIAGIIVAFSIRVTSYSGSSYPLLPIGLILVLFGAIILVWAYLEHEASTRRLFDSRDEPQSSSVQPSDTTVPDGGKMSQGARTAWMTLAIAMLGLFAIAFYQAYDLFLANDPMAGFYLLLSLILLVGAVLSFKIGNSTTKVKPRTEAVKHVSENEPASGSENTRRFCRYCGAQNKSDAVFCEKCGKNIS